MRTAAVVSALVGAVGGYAVARYVDGEAALLLGVAWWLATAAVVAVTARGVHPTTAVVTAFLLVWVGVPVVAAGVGLGLRDRAAAALEDVFGDLGELGGDGSSGGDAYQECLVDPETTFEECELVREQGG